MSDDQLQDQFRTVHDSMGELRIAAEAKWGAQTQRALQNFPISGQKVEPALLHALARVKSAAAKANAEFGQLDQVRANAIIDVANEVVVGMWDKHFPIDVFQTGSGTSTNMNMNEVIATLATERLVGNASQAVAERANHKNDIEGTDHDELVVHPNDHVNRSQSSNDAFPSAIHIAAMMGVVWVLMPELQQLADALDEKSTAFNGVVKAGRTHLMDATPVTLGQEFGGYAAMVRNGIERLQSTLPHLGELPLGGTAVGTGVNAPEGFADRVIELLSEELTLPLSRARNAFEAQGARDALVELSGALKVIAVSLMKIANDLRWMSSGPRTGLAEITLPGLQPGSSIMPGKVNPVIPEAVCQVCAQVIGNDTAVTIGGLSGNFELNVMMPVIARNVLESIRLLSSTSRVFVEKCITGICANDSKCLSYAEASPAVGTPLALRVGYDVAADVIKQAMHDEVSVRQVAITRGLLNENEANELLNVRKMTGGKEI